LQKTIIILAGATKIFSEEVPKHSRKELLARSLGDWTLSSKNLFGSMTFMSCDRERGSVMIMQDPGWALYIEEKRIKLKTE